jgi:hypothetical protein
MEPPPPSLRREDATKRTLWPSTPVGPPSLESELCHIAGFLSPFCVPAVYIRSFAMPAGGQATCSFTHFRELLSHVHIRPLTSEVSPVELDPLSAQG